MFTPLGKRRALARVLSGLTLRLFTDQTMTEPVGYLPRHLEYESWKVVEEDGRLSASVEVEFDFQGESEVSGWWLDDGQGVYAAARIDGGTFKTRPGALLLVRVSLNLF